jgi:hypothetical protein
MTEQSSVRSTRLPGHDFSSKLCMRLGAGLHGQGMPGPGCDLDVQLNLEPPSLIGQQSSTREGT